MDVNCEEDRPCTHAMVSLRAITPPFKQATIRLLTPTPAEMSKHNANRAVPNIQTASGVTTKLDNRK